MGIKDALRDTLKVAYPFLTAAATMGGPPAILAAKVLGNVLGAPTAGAPEVQATESDILGALAKASATPDMILQAQKAEIDFKLQMSQLEPHHQEELARIASEDRANARNREIQVRDNTPRVLAFLYLALFFVTLIVEFWLAVTPRAINAMVMKSIDMLLGAELGMVLGSKEYYFGTSSGSERKTDLLAQAPAIK